MFGSGRRADSPPPDIYAGQIGCFGQTGMSETAVLGGMKGKTLAMSQTGQIGSEPVTSEGFLDSEDISEAFGSLSPENRLKLYAIERVALRGTDLSPGDLLHEALCAAIMGDRKCPRHVPFMAFIVQTMRSIASHHREERRREPADGGAAQEAREARPVFSATASDPEQMLIERESEDMVGAIQDCFEGDEQAQMVVLGWSEGYRGKELRDFVGVDQAALDYAIKRIRRTMTKRYPNGWKKQ
jgi:DNA-directed RNA polymerase specialized sigma24 family protein